MTNRSLRRRLSQAETRLLSGLEKRVQMKEQRQKTTCIFAQHHAAAVAAIVLSGEPKINEPLIGPWARTLLHHQQVPWQYQEVFNIFGPPKDEKGIAQFEQAVEKSTFTEYLRATEALYHIVMNGAKEERSRFAEIFGAAPIWLLTYTFTIFDAKLLGFDLPDLSAAPKWGEIALRTAWFRWPMLPFGVMTEGDPFAEREPDPSVSIEDLLFAIEVSAKPEDEWTRPERHRMREIEPRLAGTARGPRTGISERPKS